MDTADITGMLAHARMTWRTEGQLQAEISRVLTDAGITHEREVQLAPGERIDFLAGTLGIEVKTQGSPTAVYRQLQRYAHSDRVASLLLATTRPHNAAGIPDRAGETPVYVAILRGGAL